MLVLLRFDSLHYKGSEPIAGLLQQASVEPNEPVSRYSALPMRQKFLEMMNPLSLRPLVRRLYREALRSLMTVKLRDSESLTTRDLSSLAGGEVSKLGWLKSNLVLRSRAGTSTGLISLSGNPLLGTVELVRCD